MKRIITLALTVSAIMLAMALDNYHYLGNEKIYLGIDSTAVCIYSTSSDDYLSLPSEGMKMIHEDSVCNYIYRVYELSSPMTYSKLKEYFKKNAKMSMLPCVFERPGKRLITNTYLGVKIFNLSDSTILQQHCKLFGCKIKSGPSMTSWYTLQIIPGCGRNPIDIANRLFETGCYKCSEPDLCVENIEEISYDPTVNRQWALYNHLNEDYDISVSRAWNFATGRGTTIAIIDSGIDLQHNDLSENIDSLSFDAETNSSPSKLYSEHGTLCAGVAGAVRNNNIHITGVAPDAKLMSISIKRVTNADAVVNSIDFAWKNGCDILSISCGITDNSRIRDELDNALTKGRGGKGCIIVSSAGNEGETGGNITFPANYRPEIIAVSNMTKNAKIEATSSYGDNIFVAAPGTDIVSTIPNDTISSRTGTSMACPHVAGVAALILERNPTLTAYQVREIIATTANKVGPYTYEETTGKPFGKWNNKFGYGLVDAYKAVKRTPRK